MMCGKNKSWLMMLGCLLPLIAIFTLPLFGVNNQYISLLAFVACPLTMIIMMLVNNDK